MDVITWPVATIIISIIFMIIFRKPITLLIPNIRRITKNGIEALPSQTQEVLGKKDPIEDLKKEWGRKIIIDQEEIIKKDLEALKLDTDGKISVLMRRLATLVLAFRFENLSSIIWGSQLKILEYLNSSYGVEIELIKPFYDVASQAYPAVFASYPFEQYFGFLTSNGLVVRQDNKYFITEFGREFLVYLATTGKTHYRFY